MRRQISQDSRALMLLQMNHIVKRFGGTVALDRASLEVAPGEIHALLGENGSGKSTLMKVLAGIHRADAGEIVFGGHKVAYRTPLAAAHAGIAIVHQELNLVPVMSAAENLFLGRELRSRLGVVNRRDMIAAARSVFRELEVHVDPVAPIETLPVAQCQMVEIARALLQKARLLILDEPTSALTDSDVEVLFRVIRQLRFGMASVVYISHKMAEVFAIADRYTVLRDGHTVATGQVAGTAESEIVHSMVGRQLGDYYPARHARRPDESDSIVLKVEGVCRPAGTAGRKLLRDVSFELRRGEILGFAGLVGAGRTELLETLFGAAGSNWSGRVILDGRAIRPTAPSDGISSGIALVTEDRARLGILPQQSVLANATLAELPRLARLGILSASRERQALAAQSEVMRIRRESDDSLIDSLSGGNQQKVILARWLMTNPKLLLLDEPTRGIDVGAKAEIYRVLRQLADSGIGVIFVSSELPEVLGLADRVLVMSAGRITADVPANQATEASLLEAAMAAFTAKH